MLHLRLVLLAGLWALGALVGVRPASADDLAGYSVVPQFGHSSAPTAIAVAPNGQWFATAKEAEIYLWDMKTGEILRRIAAPDEIRFLALSKDGALVLARNRTDKLWAWKAETGALLSAAKAASAEAMAWNDLQHLGEGRIDLTDDNATGKFLSLMGIDEYVPPSKHYRILETNQSDVLEVDFDTESDQGLGRGTVYIDIKNKRSLLIYVPPTDDRYCGEPWGTFAFNGRTLILAPTEKDASNFFSSAEVVDVAANPPKLEWRHYCRDFQVAGIEMRNGLIWASPVPNHTTVYDPAGLRAIARIADIGPPDGDGEPLAVSEDRRTIAYGRLVFGRNDEQGVMVLRDGAKTFHPTGKRVEDVRLSSDGLTAFGATETGWKAWKVDTGKPVAGKIEPPPTSPDRHERREETSPDGKFKRFYTMTQDGRGQSTITDASGRAIFTINGKMILAEDSLHGWSESPTQEQSVILWDLKTGKRLWTATDDVGVAIGDDQDVLVMEFPDGRVRLSKGAEKMVRLVHGFHARPFDKAAAGRFLEP